MGNFTSHNSQNIPVVPSELETSEISENFVTDVSIEERLANNDKGLGNIRIQLDNYNNNKDFPKVPFYYDSKEDQHLATSSTELKNKVADTIKLLNSSEEALLKAKYSKEEKRALEKAISNNVTIANFLANKRKTINNPLATKTRLAEINNSEFRQKQILVNRLMYVIYFILYSIALGLALASGVITIRFLSYLFALGLIYLIYTLFTTGSFLEVYGDTSMDIVKGITKEIVTEIAPRKKCPTRCIKKSSGSYQKYKSNFNNGSSDDYEPICGNFGNTSGDITGIVDTQDDSRDFRDCHIGKIESCK